MVTLLTSPAFAFILFLVFLTGWGIYWFRSGRTISGLRGKYKDAEFEVTIPPPTPPTPAVPAPTVPPQIEQQPSTSDESKGVHTILVRLLHHRAANDLSGLFAEFANARAEISALPEEDREFLEVLYRKFRLSLGDASAYDELKELHQENLKWHSPAYQLASNDLALGRHDSALQWAQKALERASSDHARADAAVMALDIELSMSGQSAMLSMATTLCAAEADAKVQAAIHKWVGDKLFASELADAAMVLYQKAVDLDPSSIDLRFNVAYAASQKPGYEFESYFHYRKLELIAESRPSVLNNLAFAAEALNSKALLGHYLERSMKVDEGWASANAAIQLAKLGLIEHAEKLLASLSEEAAKNEHVLDARQYIRDVVKTRDTDQEKLDAAADPKIRFLSACARRFQERDITGESRLLRGTWGFGELELTATVDEVILHRTEKPSYLAASGRKRAYQSRGQFFNGAYFKFILSEVNPTVTLLSPSPTTYYASASPESDDRLLLLLQTKDEHSGSWTNELHTLNRLN